MNRVIKYRAWDKVVNDMLGWHLVKQRDGFWEAAGGDNSIWELMQFSGLCDKNGKEIYEGDIISFSRTKKTVSGAHGIFSCDDIEYYRGVVKFDDGSFVIRESYAYPFNRHLSNWSSNYDPNTLKRMLHTIWCEEKSGVSDLYAEYASFEVIGNIHQNIELLKTSE